MPRKYKCGQLYERRNNNFISLLVSQSNLLKNDYEYTVINLYIYKKTNAVLLTSNYFLDLYYEQI